MLEGKSLFYLLLFSCEFLCFNFPRKVQWAAKRSISHWFLIEGRILLIWKSIYSRHLACSLSAKLGERFQPFLAVNCPFCSIVWYRLGWQFNISTIWALQLQPHTVNSRSRMSDQWVFPWFDDEWLFLPLCLFSGNVLWVFVQEGAMRFNDQCRSFHKLYAFSGRKVQRTGLSVWRRQEAQHMLA